MGKYVLVMVLLNVVHSVISSKNLVKGYYWRDYEGTIPTDALPGGMDQTGRPIYIGQVLFENKLIPGKIYETDSKIYFQWGPEQSSDKNVKILCTQYPEHFEWVLTKHDEVIRLTNTLIVKGGYEAEYFTYIGRVFAGGETTIGKVICRVAACLGLYITNEGKGIEHKEAFEILSYNPKVNTVDYSNCSSSISLIVAPQ